MRTIGVPKFPIGAKAVSNQVQSSLSPLEFVFVDAITGYKENKIK